MDRPALTRWWRDVGERMLATAVQAAVAVLVVKLGTAGSVSAMDWTSAADVAATAALLALGKGIVARRTGDPATAGFVDTRP